MSGEVPAYICSHVFENTRPVLLVSREGGDWQFMCGAEHDAGEIPHVVGLNHIIDRDPTIVALLDLPAGYEAERLAVGSPWLSTEIKGDG